MKVELQGYDKKYCYLESNVLKNKMNIYNPEQLHEKERFITYHSALMLRDDPIKGNLDLKHLQKIHKFMFGEIYDWAGKIRSVDIAKGNMFCKVQHINSMAEEVFDRLKSEKYLVGCPCESIASKMAYYFGEINALHPFREGNGRSLREYMHSLAAVSGYDLHLANISPQIMLEASIDTFNLKYDKMERLLKDNMERLPYAQQQYECERIAVKSGELQKVCKEYFQYIDRIRSDIKNTGFRPTDEAIRKMERIHRNAHQELTVREVHGIVKGKSSRTEVPPELMKDCQEMGKEFAKQETVKLEMKNDIGLSR